LAVNHRHEDSLGPYLVATADWSIDPDQERMIANRANAKTIEMNSSHVS